MGGWIDIDYLNTASILKSHAVTLTEVKAFVNNTSLESLKFHKIKEGSDENVKVEVFAYHNIIGRDHSGTTYYWGQVRIVYKTTFLKNTLLRYGSKLGCVYGPSSNIDTYNDAAKVAIEVAKYTDPIEGLGSSSVSTIITLCPGGFAFIASGSTYCLEVDGDNVSIDGYTYKTLSAAANALPAPSGCTHVNCTFQ